ncbi:hypothetical protein ACHWQZ_G000782 [Mnemiopsis leidyi]
MGFLFAFYSFVVFNCMIKSAFSCEVGKEVDLSSSNISITYDILSSNPPIVEMKKSSTVGIEFCVTSSLNINEVNHQGDKTSIYGPVTEDQLTHDLITSGTTVKLVIHYDSLGQNLQIYSSTNGALIASTRSLPELGFSDSVNSIEVIHKNGINECQIIKVQDAVPCEIIQSDWINMEVSRTSLEDGGSMTVSCSEGYHLLSGSGVVSCNGGVLSPSQSCIG